jgi:imidazolonepropionase-like amidohydrolase
MTRRPGFQFVGLLIGLVLGLGRSSLAGQAGPASVDAATDAVVFVDVDVIAMDAERVTPGQTVLVRGDRIVAIGERGAIRVPEGALVVEGRGRYLLPGLTDGHVHLAGDMPWAPTRKDFGDAPLYLAYGVTTVLNLRGGPEQLDWRRRIEAGELVGPTIYTAGEFLDEPRVETPEEVREEVQAQARAGYDLIKYHEVWLPEGDYLTTSGLSRGSYRAMVEAAREAQLPLVGHAPAHLGLDELLAAHQPLAHAGALSNIYFLPFTSGRGWIVTTAVAFGALAVILVTGSVVGVVRWRRHLPRLPRAVRRIEMLVGFVLLTASCATGSAAFFLPGGLLFDSVELRLAFTGLIVVMLAAAGVLAASTAEAWSDAGAPRLVRAHVALAAAASLALAFAGLLYWLPVAWRSSDQGINRLAQRIREAGISVQTTLVAYDAIGGPDRRLLTEDPALTYLRADTRAIWQRMARSSGPPGYRYTEFMQAVAGALHRAGVPLIAGTDAMGLGLVAPGSSLHRELDLLVESGLTPYEAIYAATVAPARFLHLEHEFGTVTPGARADLLLIDGNPLEDVTRLRQPAGVMARGRWHSRADLEQKLEGLAEEP